MLNKSDRLLVLNALVSDGVKKSKTVLDSGFHAVHSGFSFSGTWTLGFRIPQAKIFPIPECGLPYMGRVQGDGNRSF